MSKIQLNHSRNLSILKKRDDRYYDRERSKATAKQVKFYQRLWYMFKDNDIDINTELDKRNIPHDDVQHPSGRCGFSLAIDTMTKILADYGLYELRESDKKFTPTYNVQNGAGGELKRVWQKIEARDIDTSNKKNDTDRAYIIHGEKS